MVADKEIASTTVSSALAASGLLLVFLGFIQSFYQEQKARGLYTDWREGASFGLVWAIALATALATATAILGLMWLMDWGRIPIDLLAALLLAVIVSIMSLGIASVIVLVKK